MESNKHRESRRELVRRVKVTDPAGAEQYLDEMTLFSRTKKTGGKWSPWVKGTNQFFTADGVVCARNGEREFTPVMSTTVLTAADDA